MMTALWKKLCHIFVLSKEEEFEYTEEPHTSRRVEILKKHPELKKLMGHDSTITYYAIVMVAFQLVMCKLVQIYDPPFSFLTVAFLWGIAGSINHSLAIVIHECCHNLAFGHKRAWANRVLSLFANLPCAFPMASSMKKYHADHHRYLGHDFLDVDVPTKMDVLCFSYPITKVLWLFFNILVQGVRPFLKSPKRTTNWEVCNFIVQAIFDVFVCIYFGPKALLYLMLGTILGMGLHPLTGRVITEHYLLSGMRFGTYSYYGSGNYLMFNVGHHVEHHDFPYIPHTRLHMVRKMAPEFYQHLPYHTSWFKAIWKFIIDPNCGPVRNNSSKDATPLYPKSDKLHPSREADSSTGTASDDHGLNSNGVLKHSLNSNGVLNDKISGDKGLESPTTNTNGAVECTMNGSRLVKRHVL